MARPSAARKALSAFSRGGAEFLTGIFNDKFSEAKYHVLNMAAPTTLPDPAALIDLVNHGMCTPAWVAPELLKLGVPIFADGKVTPNHGLGQVWRAIQEMRLHLPEADLAWKYCVSTFDDPRKAWDAYLFRTGANREWWGKMLPLIYSRPTESDILDQYAGGFLTVDQMRMRLRENGTNLGLWDRELATRLWWPSALDTIEAYRRGFVKDSDFDTLLKGSGISGTFFVGQDGLAFPFKRDETDKVLFHPFRFWKDLANWIPSPSDLVSMMVKDVFTKTVSDEYRLFDDYDPAVDPWFKKLGMDYDIGVRGTIKGDEKPLHWGHMFWGAHWRNLGASQFFQFMHRIRPDNVAKWQRLGFKVEPFTLPRVQLGLKTDDYPPGMRDYLAAVSFKPLEVRRVQQGVRTGVLDRAAVLAAWLDHGYDKETAETATKITLAWAKYAERANIRVVERALPRKVVAETLTGYRIGSIAREPAAEILRSLLHKPGVADGYLDLEDSRLDRELTAGLIAAVRKSYLGGADTVVSAKATLIEGGIEAGRVDRYLHLWGLQRTHKRRAASSQQILSWVARGLLSEADAKTRLTNLGWDNADAALLLADANAKLSHAQAREEAAVAGSRSKLAKVLADIGRDLDRQQRQIQGRLKASQPVAKLVRLLKHGIIDAGQFRSRMQAIGILPAAVDEYIRDVVQELESKARTQDEREEARSRRATRNPPITTLKKWLKLGIINTEQFSTMAISIKVDPADLENYVQEVAADMAGKKRR